VAAAVAAGVATRAADGSLVFAPPVTGPGHPSAEAVSPGTPATPLPTAGPTAAPPLPDPPSPGTRDAPATVDGTTVGGSAVGGSAVGTPAPATGAPGSGTAGAPADLDELARRLFDPLSARLRAELRLDRERAGVHTDLRH
jgi:hypothetical protein